MKLSDWLSAFETLLSVMILIGLAVAFARGDIVSRRTLEIMLRYIETVKERRNGHGEKDKDEVPD